MSVDYQTHARPRQFVVQHLTFALSLPQPLPGLEGLPHRFQLHADHAIKVAAITTGHDHDHRNAALARRGQHVLGRVGSGDRQGAHMFQRFSHDMRGAANQRIAKAAMGH